MSALDVVAVLVVLAALAVGVWSVRPRRRRASPPLAGADPALRDASARIRAEEELRQSEERMRLVLDAVDDGIWDWDVARDLMVFSPRAASLLGRLPGDLPNLAAVRSVLRTDELAAFDAQLAGFLDGSAPFLEIEVPVVTGAGESRWMLLRGRVVSRDRNRAALRALGTISDVTERNRLKASLALADRMASVGTLAAGVAHEMNNPLTYVTANLAHARELIETAATLRGAPPELSSLLGPLRGALDDALQGADRVARIVKDLKTFSRDDERRLPVDARAALESALQLARGEIKKRARLVRDLEDVPLVDGSESRLGQVFLNLLVNAAQAIPDGAPERHEIRVSSRVRDGWVEISVEDTGCGIPREVLGRIFDPFFTTKPVGTGTGLGLAICHEIVAAFGGEIGVESEVGHGSRFTVRLRPARAAAAPSARASAGEAPERRAPPRARILVVDDEELVAEAIERILSSDHDVVAVGSGRDALRRLGDGSRFDAVVCDLLMPEMSGADFWAELHRRDPTLAACTILVTGAGLLDEARTAMGAFSGPIVEKPFTAGDLREAIGRVLARPSAAR
ncbi:MAG TPA: ATP-binding protein [Anaeromyxobacter sp.]|nr:ATP-binding protein [Anaeromyxobacter sp.]